MKKISGISMLIFLLVFTACDQKPQKQEEQKISESKDKTENIFPKGEKVPSENFTGEAYNRGLVDMDSIYTSLVGNVHFKAGARSNWHSHPAGQILLVTDGVGYHQIKGKAKETIRKGDVIKCPPNTDHWHGASKDSSMTHIYILPNTDKGVVEWKKAVTDEQYSE